MWLHQCVVGSGPLDSRLRGNDVMVMGMTVGGRMRGGNDVMVMGMTVGGRMRGGNDVMVVGMTAGETGCEAGMT